MYISSFNKSFSSSLLVLSLLMVSPVRAMDNEDPKGVSRASSALPGAGDQASDVGAGAGAMLSKKTLYGKLTDLVKEGKTAANKLLLFLTGGGVSDDDSADDPSVDDLKEVSRTASALPGAGDQKSNIGAGARIAAVVPSDRREIEGADAGFEKSAQDLREAIIEMERRKEAILRKYTEKEVSAEESEEINRIAQEVKEYHRKFEALGKAAIEFAKIQNEETEKMLRSAEEDLQNQLRKIPIKQAEELSRRYRDGLENFKRDIKKQN